MPLYTTSCAHFNSLLWMLIQVFPFIKINLYMYMFQVCWHYDPRPGPSRGPDQVRRVRAGDLAGPLRAGCRDYVLCHGEG